MDPPAAVRGVLQQSLLLTLQQILFDRSARATNKITGDASVRGSAEWSVSDVSPSRGGKGRASWSPPRSRAQVRTTLLLLLLVVPPPLLLILTSHSRAQRSPARAAAHSVLRSSAEHR